MQVHEAIPSADCRTTCEYRSAPKKWIQSTEGSPSSFRPFLCTIDEYTVDPEIYAYVPCLAIKVTEFAVLRLDLGRIDLRMMCEDILPPLLLVQLLQVDMNGFLVL